MQTLHIAWCTNGFVLSWFCHGTIIWQDYMVNITIKSMLNAAKGVYCFFCRYPCVSWFVVLFKFTSLHEELNSPDIYYMGRCIVQEPVVLAIATYILLYNVLNIEWKDLSVQTINSTFYFAWYKPSRSRKRKRKNLNYFRSD